MPDNDNNKYQLLSDVTEAVENPSTLQEVADMKLRLINALGSISAGPYTPAVLADWDGSADPGDINGALDQLAERVKDVEGGAIAVDAAGVTYTPFALPDWTGGTDPGQVDDALDQVANRTTDAEAEIVALQTAINSLISQGNSSKLSQIVAGGKLIWEHDLVFLVTAATYYINGVLFTSDEQEVTLSPADGANPRIDLIVLGDDALAVSIDGTAASDPSKPPFDPATQVEVGFVLVDTNATEPVVTVETIYTENAGEAAEWTMGTNGSGIVTNSTNNPRSGTKDIEATNMANNAYFKGVNNATINPNDYQYLIFYIRSKAAWNANRFLSIQFRVGGITRGSQVTFGNGYYGFNSSNVADYQGIVIPIQAFNVPAGSFIDEIRFTDQGGAIGFYIDDISLQTSNQVVTKLPPATFPGSINKAVQFNDNGFFGGESGFEYDKATNILSVPTISLSVGANVGVNTLTMSGTLTLTTASKRYQSLDPDGSARNVDLPAEATDLAFFIVNRGNGAETITVRNDAADTVDTIDNDEGLSVICDGTRWISAKAALVIV